MSKGPAWVIEKILGLPGLEVRHWLKTVTASLYFSP